jgi:hypothetical protein
MSYSRHARLLLEATVEPGRPAMALRSNLGGLPGDRFRVRIGELNSRFLARGAAESVAHRYAGTVVEMFTSAQWIEEKARGLDKCPACNCAQGKPCVTKQGKIRHAHRTRTAA